jgi:DNA polymerase-3 subunit delta'
MSDPIAPLDALRGQPAAVMALGRLALGESSIPPLLLHGPRGAGKRTAALAFAAELVCAKRGSAGPCGRCGPCSRIAQSEAITAIRASSSGEDTPRPYPDAGLVSIAGRRTRITVLQARDIALSLATRPFELPFRIYIVDPADQMTNAAANALLKTLEEPPPYAVLILVTTAPWKLPATVRSRLRAIRFGPLLPADIAAILAGSGVDHDEAARRARFARGDLTRARELDPEQESRRVERWVEILAGLENPRRAPALAVLAGDQLAGDREQARGALVMLLELLRDLAVVSRGGTPEILDERQLDRLAPHATRLVGRWMDGPRMVDTLERELQVFNRNPRLATEGAVLALAGQLDRSELLLG